MDIEFTDSSSSGDVSDDDSAELVEKNKSALAEIEVKFLEEEEPARRYKEHVFIAENLSFQIVSFLHPKTGSLVKFAVDNGARKVYEIQRMKRIPSSYFIDEEVKEDGSLFVTTPMDPLYLLLRNLEECRASKSAGDVGVFVALYEILSRNNIQVLGPALDTSTLGLICDEKSLDDTQYYRLSNEKLVNWLRHKVDAIATHLAKDVSSAMSIVRAQAQGYRARVDSVDDTVRLKLVQIAVGILSEYLPPSVYKLLKDYYGEALSSTVAIKHSAAISTEGELYDDAKYGKVTDNKRKTPSGATIPEKTPEKKRKVKAHEKIDTKKIAPLTSFFAVKK